MRTLIIATLLGLAACGEEEVVCGSASSYDDAFSCNQAWDCPEDELQEYTIECECGAVECHDVQADAQAAYECTCLHNGVVTGTFETVDFCLDTTDQWVIGEQACGFELYYGD